MTPSLPYDEPCRTRRRAGLRPILRPRPVLRHSSLTFRAPTYSSIISGIFEPRAFEDIDDGGLDALLRKQRSQRRTSHACISAGHARARLGAGHLRVERIRFTDSRRDDPLRRYQDGPNCARARYRRISCRNRNHGEQRAAGPTKSEGVGVFVKQLAERQNIDEAEMERQFFESARPSSLLKRFITPDEVANLIVYLCTPAAAATTGAALRVDGGVVRAIP